MAVLVSASALVWSGTPSGYAAALPGDGLPFASATFRATHNSYSGNLEGDRGSLRYQLDHGVRFIELDIHSGDHLFQHDYQVGHGGPGDRVDHSGNPVTNGLRSWLNVVANWSRANPTHAPLVVMLDLKDDLTTRPSFAAGNLMALNQELSEVFGDTLVAAKDVPGALPTIGALRGRVLTLLSGDRSGRTEYRRDVGYHPAVAINAHGQIVEVHDSGAGSLWYWTGAYGADGRVTWLRHGRYDTGQTPAVALNDSGALVEVHQAPDDPTLWYRVGQLAANGEIGWSPARRYDTGVLPTISFVDATGTALREIHRGQSSSQNWDWRGTLAVGATTVAWDAATHGRTTDPRYQASMASRGAMRVSVWTGAEGGTPSQTLHYTTTLVPADRVRYRQVAFVEYQPTDGLDLQLGSLFWASAATNRAFAPEARANGRIVRGWDFDDPTDATVPLATYPATNHPYAGWYLSMMDAAGAVR